MLIILVVLVFVIFCLVLISKFRHEEMIININDISLNNNEKASIEEKIEAIAINYDKYVEIDPTEIRIEAKDIYKKPFETSGFVVFYPDDRRVYGENDFSLCPIDDCQDSEMNIKSEEIQKGDINWWLDNQSEWDITKISRYPDTLKYVIYPNIYLGDNKGVGVSLVRLKDLDVEGDGNVDFYKEDGSSLVMSVAFEMKDKLVYGYLDVKKQTHQNIWSSIQVK